MGGSCGKRWRVPLEVFQVEDFYVVEDLAPVAVAHPSENHQKMLDDIRGMPVPGTWRRPSRLHLLPFERIPLPIQINPPNIINIPTNNPIPYLSVQYSPPNIYI